VTGVAWHDVPEAEGLWEGDILDVEVAGEPVVIAHHLDGSWTAFQGLCPHQELLLADGKWDEESCVLSCYGHLWQFDLKSGDGINPAGPRLYRYPIEETDGAVRVGIPQDGKPHYSRFHEATEEEEVPAQ
jgi:toluene monooxygenase system ferredoxin subunit